MQNKSTYESPFGKIIISANEICITGLWFYGEKFFPQNIYAYPEEENPIIKETKKWLDIYFAGKKPNTTPAVSLIGSPFQISVWEILQNIPYGSTITYGEIAKQIARSRGLSRMSAQAVGGAVGHNPISIIIPCHRVIGADGSLTGYAGGMDKKAKLLKLEGAL